MQQMSLTDHAKGIGRQETDIKDETINECLIAYFFKKNNIKLKPKFGARNQYLNFSHFVKFGHQISLKIEQFNVSIYSTQFWIQKYLCTWHFQGRFQNQNDVKVPHFNIKKYTIK